jgi:hypothetical protein
MKIFVMPVVSIICGVPCETRRGEINSIIFYSILSMASLKKSEGKKITDDRLLFLLGSKSCAAEFCRVCSQIQRKYPALPPPSPPIGAGGWRERPNLRHSITNKALRRRPRSTMKIYRLNNKVEWKVKYASLSYFTG